MENRVVVTICGQDYTLISTETPTYMQQLGAYVSQKMTELQSGGQFGRADAAVLAAVNIADELMKERSAAEQLRVQIRQSSDEAGKAQIELSELKREVFRLQQKLDGKGGRTT